jgi:hypothetical protein
MRPPPGSRRMRTRWRSPGRSDAQPPPRAALPRGCEQAAAGCRTHQTRCGPCPINRTQLATTSDPRRPSTVVGRSACRPSVATWFVRPVGFTPPPRVSANDLGLGVGVGEAVVGPPRGGGTLRAAVGIPRLGVLTQVVTEEQMLPRPGGSDVADVDVMSRGAPRNGGSSGAARRGCAAAARPLRSGQASS